MSLWTATREWEGETCFIVCGGESVRKHDLSRLAGRRVIVINSSAYAYPAADFLVFTDRRWWEGSGKRIPGHADRVRSIFRGRVVTTTPMRPRPNVYLLMERQRSSGLSPHPRHLALWHTTTTAATNLAAHLGVRAINYLGLDGHGGWHHEPHPWPQVARKFYHHGEAMKKVAESLLDLDIRARVTPQSSYDFFERVSYDEMLS